MVSTFQIKPAPLLQPFVSCYALREFNTGNFSMLKPFHAVHEYYMSFFLKDQFCEVENSSSKMVGKYSNSITTFFTEWNGCSYWKGNYKIFCVQLKSNGIFAIFGIPQKILLNNVLPLEDILGNDNKHLTEQFESCKEINQMGILMNSYLTKKLLSQKQKIYTNTIAATANIIFQNKGIVSLDKLAHYANMSFRNFERKFVDEVGMPPKLYARITRFYNALENKMLHPYKSWTEITYENGYFDQAHFIKEVKAFSSKTPEELFKDTPPPAEDFISK